MFTINLLASPGPRRRTDVRRLTVRAAVAAIVLVVLAAWGAVLTVHLNHLRRDLAKATQEAAQLRPTAQQVQELRRSAERMRTRRGRLQQLLATQMPASQFLETIRSMVPHDVWLTSVTAGTSDVTVEGYTFSYPSVARFMVELGGSGSIRNIDLATSQRETVADSEVLKFRITGDLVAVPTVTSQQGAPSRKETTP